MKAIRDKNLVQDNQAALKTSAGLKDPNHEAPFDSNKNNANVEETCLICYVDFDPNDINSPLGCGHKFCLDCYRSYFENKMQMFHVLNISCPQDGCPQVFKDEQIKSILSEDKYTRYQELVLKKLENKVVKAKLCPKPGCARPLPKITKSKKEYIKCLCGAQICTKCLNLWHPGKSCLNVLDPEFELYAQQNGIKPCVMCQTPVARVEGCLHMTCCVCDYEWCWTCGKQYHPRHKCKGVWEPSEPFVFSRQNILNKIWIIFKLTLLLIFFVAVVIPVVTVLCLLFWPLGIDKLAKKLSWRRKLQSLKIILLSGLVGLLTLPFTILWILIVSFIILPIRIIVITRRRGIKFWFRRFSRRRPKKQRWRSGKLEKFTYTQVARPTNDANDVVVANNRPPRNTPLILRRQISQSMIEDVVRPRRRMSLPEATIRVQSALESNDKAISPKAPKIINEAVNEQPRAQRRKSCPELEPKKVTRETKNKNPIHFVKQRFGDVERPDTPSQALNVPSVIRFPTENSKRSSTSGPMSLHFNIENEERKFEEEPELQLSDLMQIAIHNGQEEENNHSEGRDSEKPLTARSKKEILQDLEQINIKVM